MASIQFIQVGSGKPKVGPEIALHAHKVIVCSTESKRLDVLDVSMTVKQLCTENWGDHAHVVAGKWLFDNPSKELKSSHLANGNLYIWVEDKQGEK